MLGFGAREGQVLPFTGTLGQFSGRVALATGGQGFYLASFIPENVTKARQGIFTTNVSTDNTFKYGPAQGDIAPSVMNNETFRSFLAVNERDFIAVLRATLKGGPVSQNEGIWNCGSVLHLRKGEVFDAVNHPGLFVKRILKFWPVGTDQLVVQALLGGTGVKGTNNQALLLRQEDGDWQILLRSGDPAPGVPPAVVSKLSVAEVDRVSGCYAVLGTLKGAPAAANQALWTGQTSLGNDDDDEELRMPRLALRKGDVYTTGATPAGQIKSLLLKPVVDKAGAGARGQGLVVASDGSVMLTILGDRKVQELASMEP